MQYVSENIGGEKSGNSNKILAHIWSALPHMMENECGTLGGSNMEGSLTLKWIKTGLELAIFPVHNISAACHVGTSLQSPAIFTCWLTFMAYRGTLMRFSHNNISYTCAFPAMTNQNPCLINSSQAGLSNRNMCGSWHIRTVKSLLFLLVHHGYWWQTQTRARTVRFFFLTYEVMILTFTWLWRFSKCIRRSSQWVFFCPVALFSSQLTVDKNMLTRLDISQ